MYINWDEVPEGFDYALTTAPDWDGELEYEGTIRFAKKVGNSTYFECSEGKTLVVGPYCWMVLATRPEKWDGEGLPPVGTVCEYYADEDTWRQCEIIAHKDGKAVVWVNHAHIWSTSSGALLRPLKTKEQLAAEEREKAVDEMVQFFMSYYGNPKGAEQYLLICRSLYGAGYRKQESNDAKA